MKSSQRSQSSSKNVSLARALSKFGVASRSQSMNLVAAGRVSVNGAKKTDPSFRVAMEKDEIAVDGRILCEEQFLYIMLNKPVGCVTTRSDERGNPTVYDYLQDIEEWIFPVGRLDKETGGLLLFTNDHRLGERLTNPSSRIPKTYRVTLDRPIGADHLHEFEKGMMLGKERLLPAVVEHRKGSSFDMTIVEGKNRQIRRMCENFGYMVKALTRIRLGGFSLQSLESGRWKKLSAAEVRLLERNS